MSSKFLDKTGLDTLWAKIKSTFQTLGNKVTSVRATSSASDDKYPSEKAVASALDGKVPFNYCLLDTNPFGGKHLYLNYICNAMYSMDKRYFVTATRHNKVVDGVEYPRIKPGAAVIDDVYYEDSPVVIDISASSIRNLFNGSYESLVNIPAGQYLKIHIQFSNEDNWSPATGRTSDYDYNYGRYLLSFYNNKVPASAKWRCYNTYTAHTVGWKQGDFSYYAGNASSTSAVILSAQDSSNHKRTCIEFIVFAKDDDNTQITQIDWKLDRPTLSKSFPFFTNFADQNSYVSWYFREKANYTPTIALTPENGNVKAVTFEGKLKTSRKLAVSLSNTSTDTSFDGSTDVTNIKTTGTLGVGNGGTGKTTAKAAEYSLTTGKSEISDTTSGDDRVVFELASPSESNGVTRGFRKLSTIWTWIKGLLSSDSGVNISGNAATATAAAGYTSGGDIDTALQGKADKSSTVSSVAYDGTNKKLTETINGTPTDIVATETLKTDMGLAAVATSGSYSDLSGTPTIPAAQVQADWAQTDTSAVDYIKNKPSAVMWLTYYTSYTNEQISGWLASGYLLCVSYYGRVYVYAKDYFQQGGTHNYFFVDAHDYEYLRASIGSSTCTWSEGDNYPAYVKYLEGTVSSARDTMTVSKDSSNQTVVSSGDGTTAAPVFIRPKGHTAADNQFVVHEDGSISLNNFHSRFGYIEHHMDVANGKVIRFGFSRTASNVAHRDSCIRLQYARNGAPFEVRIAINIEDSGTLEGIGATVTVCNSVISVNAPKVYSYSNANWHWVFVAFSRGDGNIDHYLNWEYSGENSDGLNVTLVEAVHSDASAVTLRFIPIGNVNVDSGSFTGIGSATRPVYVNSSGQFVACDIFYA